MTGRSIALFVAAGTLLVIASDQDSARAYAGLLWTKQLYRFDVAHWLARHRTVFSELSAS